MRLSSLIPKRIIDKNGKQNTVYIKPEIDAPTRHVPIPINSNPDFHRSISITGWPTRALAGVDSEGKWDGRKLEHERVLIGGYESWHIAPEGRSGAYCYQCHSFYPKDTHDFFNAECEVCGFTSMGKPLSGIREEFLGYFDTSTVKDDRWFHITTNPDWGKDINDPEYMDKPFVHVGTEEAAYERMRDIIKDLRGASKPDFYLYEVSVKESAPVHPAIISDYDISAPKTINQVKEEIANDISEDGTSYDDRAEFFEMYELNGVTAYMNEYESVGSVSLIAHPDSLEIIGVKAINLD